MSSATTPSESKSIPTLCFHDVDVEARPNWQEETSRNNSTLFPRTDSAPSTLNLDLRWDSSTDADNPKNWPQWKRMINSVILSVVSLLSSFASSIVVPAVEDILVEFGVLGLGFGPFLLAPLSELYGRKLIYTSTLGIFSILQLGCALTHSITALIVLRFASGLMGGMAPSLGQASISDIWEGKDRGRWAALNSLGAMLGPPLGNFAGKYSSLSWTLSHSLRITLVHTAAALLQEKPWPWIFWSLTVMQVVSGSLFITMVIFLKESYEPTILRNRRKQRRKAHHLNESSKIQDPMCLNEALSCPKVTTVADVPDPATVFYRAITRPWRFLTTNPLLFMIGSFLAYIYGMFYVLLTSIPLLFENEERVPQLFNYGFDQVESGLSYLGIILGFLVGFVFQINVQPRLWTFLTKRNGESRPEYRLYTMSAGIILFPVSLLIYGWSASKHTHWIFPELGLTLFAIGTFIIFQSIQVYLAEAFIPYGASAIAAATLMRALAGAAFPLFGRQLFIGLGYGEGATLLAFLALPAIPLSWILYLKGGSLRARWQFQP
ncbi:hypothetical protein M422DRAFT_241474 [Sphaerobolus stellatus SS14]|nr:hypothetical protein M422DRAFT_241474 [Sphaerobolus stellatus SS14]